jgi:quinol monooxygenase YgiN
MAFIQVVSFETSNYDEVKALSDEYQAKIGDDSTVQRYYVARDRANPDRYVITVFFDSYEAAMKNSQHPATDEFAQKQRKLVTNMSFQDLDVIEENS